MSKLQELLDEKWPLGKDIHSTEEGLKRMAYRQLFTEGYNAAIDTTTVEVLQYRGLLTELARFLALEKYKQYPKEIQRLLDKYPNVLEQKTKTNAQY